jgi:hypothetical protein
MRHPMRAAAAAAPGGCPTTVAGCLHTHPVTPTPCCPPRPNQGSITVAGRLHAMPVLPDAGICCSGLLNRHGVRVRAGHAVAPAPQVALHSAKPRGSVWAVCALQSCSCHLVRRVTMRRVAMQSPAGPHLCILHQFDLGGVTLGGLVPAAQGRAWMAALHGNAPLPAQRPRCLQVAWGAASWAAHQLGVLALARKFSTDAGFL